MLVKARCPSQFRNVAIAASIEAFGGLPGVLSSGAIPLYDVRFFGRKGSSGASTYRRGWRVLVVNDQEMLAAADLSKKNDEIHVHRLHGKGKCRLVVDAAATAEKIVGRSRTRYRPGILRLPGRVAEILWLRSEKGRTNRFIILGYRVPSRAVLAMLRSQFNRVSIHSEPSAVPR